MSVREALRAHARGRAGDMALLRAIAEWPAWSLPLGADGGIALRVDGEGGHWMQILSAPLPGAESVQIPGWELLPELADGLAGLEIDPGAPESARYVQAQLSRLRAFGRAAAIERLLRGESAVDDPLRALREHPDFTMLSRAPRGGLASAAQGARRGARLLLVPDDRGRRLAAVFTAWDAALAFLSALEADPSSVEPLSVGGAEMFAWLRGLSLDGVVFNPAGPGAPIPAAMALADQVLEGAPEP